MLTICADFFLELSVTADDSSDIYFNNNLIISETTYLTASHAQLNFTTGSCVVAAKITNWGGPGRFLASTSNGHVSNAQVRCSEREEEEGWWREDFNHWHWPAAALAFQNDGSQVTETDEISQEAYFVEPVFDNWVSQYFCRWNLCGVDCSTLENIHDRASTHQLKIISPRLTIKYTVS